MQSFVMEMLIYSLGLTFRKLKPARVRASFLLSAAQGNTTFMEKRIFWKALWVWETFLPWIILEVFNFIDIR